MGFTMAAVPCSVETVKPVQLVIKLMDLVQMAVQIYTSLRFAQVFHLFSLKTIPCVVHLKHEKDCFNSFFYYLIKYVQHDLHFTHI